MKKWYKFQGLGFIVVLLTVLFGITNNIRVVQAAEDAEETVQQIPEGYTAIYNIADLYAIRNNPSGKYILMNDIDMTEDTKEGREWEQGNGWEAIESFSGVFDGNGYRIIGIQIFGEFNESKRLGLFGKTDHAQICNLGIKNCNIDVTTCNSNENYYIGGIVGEALAGTTVQNCYLTGTMKIQGDSNNCEVGGLIGRAYVSSYYDEEGANILVKNCYNACNINCSEATAGRFAGGIIGYADAWYGNWKVNEYINYHGCIGMENVYNVGTITGNEWCVTQKDGTPTTGALCGYYSMRENGFGGCIKSYYLKGSSQQGIGNQADSTEFGSLSEVQMKAEQCFTGFDFINAWEIDPYCSYSYPQLKNNRLIRVTSVKLQTQPAKIVYNQGDELDLSGSTIEVCYEDGIKTTIPVSAEMISGYDTNEIGTQTVTVTYGSVKTSFIIEVKKIPVGTIITVNHSKCKVKILSNATTPTVEYVSTTNKNAASIKIPNTVTVGNVTYKVVSIATGAFRNNKKITKVTIGSNVTTIGSNVFSGCSKLKTVSMGANVTTINAKAFYKCIGLTKIMIPAKVSKIGKQAFYGCKKLKSITIKTTKLTRKKVGSKAFKGIYSKATIKVPKEKFSSYKKILKTKGVGSKAKINK